MFVITGATGVVGREAVRLLVRRGIEVAAVTRNPRPDLPEQAQLVHPADVATLKEVEGILLSPRAVGAAAADLLERVHDRRKAVKAVLLSASTVPYPAGDRRFRQQFQAAEDIARGSGLSWTILRCADFAANTLAWAGQIKATGTVLSAHPRARTSTVDERDIAEVAVLALTQPGHGGRTYLLTGEQSLSQPEKVAAISAALDRPLSFVETTPEKIRQSMLAAGLPGEIPDRLLGSLADYAREAGPTSHEVARLLGTPARTYATWASDHSAAFAAPEGIHP